MLDWHELGDGSVYDGMPEEGESAEEVFRDPDAVRNAYGESIEYTLTSLFSFLETYPDPDLVVVLLGDHQPHSYVTGDDPGHDVPISVIAQDPSVMAQISAWGWQDGLHPSPDAPVWPMDPFRDRFLSAFSPKPPPDLGQVASTSAEPPAVRRRPPRPAPVGSPASRSGKHGPGDSGRCNHERHQDEHPWSRLGQVGVPSARPRPSLVLLLLGSVAHADPPPVAEAITTPH